MPLMFNPRTFEALETLCKNRKMLVVYGVLKAFDAMQAALGTGESEGRKKAKDKALDNTDLIEALYAAVGIRYSHESLSSLRRRANERFEKVNATMGELGFAVYGKGNDDDDNN
jgi:hypothetical protein